MSSEQRSDAVMIGSSILSSLGQVEILNPFQIALVLSTNLSIQYILKSGT